MSEYFPDDALAFQHAHELTRDARRSEAAAAYGAISQRWHAEGRYLKAAPMFRLAIALDGTRLDFAKTLAAIYAELGL